MVKDQVDQSEGSGACIADSRPSTVLHPTSEGKNVQTVLDGSHNDAARDEPASEKKIRKRRPRKKVFMEQTDPPSVEVFKIFPKGQYPVGELLEYTGTHASRINSEEMREKEKIKEEDYDNLRRAAEVHREVRKYMKGYIKPGMKMIDICETLEDLVRTITPAKGLESGIGFPTGCSLNNCAAHYTPNAGDNTVLQYDDVMKLDFGVHVKGLIIDSAFTIAFNPKYENLVEAAREATNAGVKEAGIDLSFKEFGSVIQEVMESYEIELNGRIYPIKCIANLCGHSIGRYEIHSGKTVPIVKTTTNQRMEEGELYAIETFGTTGKGYVTSSMDCSHYMLNKYNRKKESRVKSANQLLKNIIKNFDTLPFCCRYLDRLGLEKYNVALNHLLDEDIVEDYPPLCDISGSYTSQFEHTILLRPTQKEVLSRGDDY